MLSPTLVSTRRPIREFCSLSLLSVRFPLVVVEKGMLPKLVPIPVPGFVERFTLVKSAKPMGVMKADPKAHESGAFATTGAGGLGTMNSGAGPAEDTFAVVFNETGRVEPL